MNHLTNMLLNLHFFKQHGSSNLHLLPNTFNIDSNMVRNIVDNNLFDGVINVYSSGTTYDVRIL